ncbi:MAG: peptidogalycan biosysnthesis protein, partial [Chromatiales bacterium]
MGDLRLDIIESLDAVSSQEWNRVAGTSNPFLRHEFLAALEHQGCVGERYGWIPQHLSLRDEAGRLVGAAPLYLKLNSYGEFVFDWSWAHAYD